ARQTRREGRRAADERAEPRRLPARGSERWWTRRHREDAVLPPAHVPGAPGTRQRLPGHREDRPERIREGENRAAVGGLPDLGRDARPDVHAPAPNEIVVRDRRRDRTRRDDPGGRGPRERKGSREARVRRVRDGREQRLRLQPRDELSLEGVRRPGPGVLDAEKGGEARRRLEEGRGRAEGGGQAGRQEVGA